jgi:type I restriction enzyme S subunit
MIADLKPYPEYEESGSKWRGAVPAHWEVRNLRTLIKRRNERNRLDLPLLSVAREKGVFVRSLTDPDENHNVIPEDLSNYKVARSGNLVINKMKAWQGSMGIAPCDGIVSPAYFVFDFNIANRAYGQKLLRSKPYVAHFAQASDGVRVGQWDLAIPGMRQIPVLVPPSDEQAAIVKFLDYVNRKIDRFIRAKRKMIALLNEQKQAIIHRAVTRGLNPNVKLKPSGITWLGDIPEHWESWPLRRCISIRSGDYINAFRIRTEQSEQYSIPVVGGNGVMGYTDRANNDGATIVIGRVGALCGNVHLIQGSAWITDNALRITRINGFDAVFLTHQLRVMDLNRLANSNAQPLVTGGIIKTQRVVKPPLYEQGTIVLQLIGMIVPLNTAITRTQNEIALIQEYRTRLTADIVTGKLDVREAAKNLPEIEIEEESIADETAEGFITETEMEEADE